MLRVRVLVRWCRIAAFKLRAKSDLELVAYNIQSHMLPGICITQSASSAFSHAAQTTLQLRARRCNPTVAWDGLLSLPSRSK
eukprot:scaffold175602_cov30-Tisochrysis_lutea.AAC.1